MRNRGKFGPDGLRRRSLGTDAGCSAGADACTFTIADAIADADAHPVAGSADRHQHLFTPRAAARQRGCAPGHVRIGS